MAKRGGNYNLFGASGWEWFELAPSDNGTPVIVWRGITPPDGEGYGGAAGGACNNCHGSSPDNDHVLSDPLQLSRF
jgi:hypothetical protein